MIRKLWYLFYVSEYRTSRKKTPTKNSSGTRAISGATTVVIPVIPVDELTLTV